MEKYSWDIYPISGTKDYNATFETVKYVVSQENAALLTALMVINDTLEHLVDELDVLNNREGKNEY